MYINLWNPVMIREQVDFSIVYCLESGSRIFHFHWVNIQMRVYVQQRIHTYSYNIVGEHIVIR